MTEKTKKGTIGGIASLLAIVAASTLIGGSTTTIDTNSFVLTNQHEFLTYMAVDLDDSIDAGLIVLRIGDDLIDIQQVNTIENLAKFESIPTIFNPVTNLKLEVIRQGQIVGKGVFRSDGTIRMVVNKVGIREIPTTTEGGETK